MTDIDQRLENIRDALPVYHRDNPWLGAQCNFLLDLIATLREREARLRELVQEAFYDGAINPDHTWEESRTRQQLEQIGGDK